MKKLSLIIVSLLVVLVCCKKTPQVNIQYVDVEREVLTIGATTVNIQCDYEYITTLKSAKLYYGKTDSNMHSVNMRVVQSTLYAEISGLSTSTTYRYYYEFENGFNSMQSENKTFVTENSSSIVLPTIITADISGITNNSAICGGQVTDNGGGSVIARGICWSISANPTISDSHTTDGSGLGTFTSNMAGLSSNTTYHVRAYAINESGTAYGLDKTFTTLNGGGGGDHEWVDLGLPSGILWATCNVGANSPEEYGDYFAWGETQPKNNYTFATYRYFYVGTQQLIKYCTDPNFGYNAFTDDLAILLPEDDAATANWGDDWSMPNDATFQELLDNTTVIWTNQNGVNGLLFTSPYNGNSLFLPAAGYRWDSHLSGASITGGYWSSSLMTDYPNNALFLNFDLDVYHIGNNGRSGGFSVRPVRDTPINK